MLITADVARLRALYAGAVETARTPPERPVIPLGLRTGDSDLGRAVTGGPNDMSWGQRVARTTAPDGNVVNPTTPHPTNLLHFVTVTHYRVIRPAAGYCRRMTQPDPGGTPDPGSGSLTRTPTTTEQSKAGEVEPPEATPGAYDADDAERERGKHVKPGG